MTRGMTERIAAKHDHREAMATCFDGSRRYATHMKIALAPSRSLVRLSADEWAIYLGGFRNEATGTPLAARGTREQMERLLG